MASEAKLDLVVGVTDKASGPLSKISGGLGKLGGIAGGALLGGLGLATAGIAGLGTALMGGIGDAREAAQVMAATENVIRSMGRTGQISAEQIAEMAGSLSAAEGKSLFGDSDIQAGQNMLLTFANINEVLPQATQAMVDMTQFMGGDMVGASTMLGKALDNPTQGLSALSRVGVSFTEQQKEQIKTMQEAGDMAGAQGIILQALESQFGGAALAAAQADGGMAMFKDRMGELAESIGAQVLPALNAVLAWLNSPEVQAGIAATANAIINGLGAAFTWISTVAWPALRVAFEYLSGTVVPAVQRAFEVAWPLIKRAIEITWDYLQTVVFPNAERMFGQLMNTIALVRAKFEEAWPYIRAAIAAVYDWLTGTVWPWIEIAWANLMTWQDNMQANFEIVWPAVKGAVSAVYTYFRDTVWPWLQTAMSNIGTWIATARDAWSTAWGAISGAVTTAQATISGAIATIRSLVQGAIGKINELINLINNIPGVNIPNIPSGPSSGFGGNSLSQSYSVNVDARGSSLSARQIEVAVDRAMARVGVRTDLRMRTT